MGEPRQPSADDIHEHLEQTTRPKDDFAGDFDRLVMVVYGELSTQVAMGVFGEAQRRLEARLVLSAAAMIADEIDEVFRLEPKRPERGSALDPSPEQAAALAEIKTHIRRG